MFFIRSDKFTSHNIKMCSGENSITYIAGINPINGYTHTDYSVAIIKINRFIENIDGM